MKYEGNVKAARSCFFDKAPRNLQFLLYKRYGWMNSFLGDAKSLVEVGCGAGLSKEFIQNERLILTDTIQNPWVDLEADALAMPFADQSLDVVISSHMVHHLASPIAFFREMHRVLKPGGLLLIQEINTSLLMRILLRVMHHEGWSYDVDVFDPSTIVNDPRDPWSANCAIPEMLFEDAEAFARNITSFHIIKNDRCECLTFVLSGGVIAKTATINLPCWALQLADRLDTMLVSLWPSVFALGRNVVLQRV